MNVKFAHFTKIPIKISKRQKFRNTILSSFIKKVETRYSVCLQKNIAKTVNVCACSAVLP